MCTHVYAAAYEQCSFCKTSHSQQVEVTFTLVFPYNMEMTSSILRFALATYFMKHSGRPFPYHVHDTSSWTSSASATSSICPTPTAALCQEDENELSSKFSDVVSTHMSNLRQLLVEQRLEEWSKGVMALREYVATNGLVGAFVTLLVELLERQEQDAVSIVQGGEDG